MILVCATREPNCCQCLDSYTDPESCPDCVLGSEISNSLISTQLVAESRARAYLDEEHQNKRRVQGTCTVHNYMKPKSVVQMTDRVHGTFQGQLSKFSINISSDVRGNVTASSTIEVLKVQE